MPEIADVSGTAIISRDRDLIRGLYKPDWKAWFPKEEGNPRRDGGPVGHVAGDADGGGAGVGQLLGRVLGALEVEEGELVAVLGEGLGGAEADARRPARDDCDPAHAETSTVSNSRWMLLSPRRIHVGS